MKEIVEMSVNQHRLRVKQALKKFRAGLYSKDNYTIKKVESKKTNRMA